MASFSVPKINVNAEGWGPTADNIPEQFQDLPFAPFSKGDLGKGFRAADFTASGSSYYRFQKYRQNRADEGVQNKELQYKYDGSEDASFSLVDTAKTQKKFGGVGRRAWGGRGRGGKGWGGRGGWGKGGKGGKGRDGKGGKGSGRGRDEPQRRRNDPRGNDRRRTQGGRGGNRRFARPDRQASVKVQADWRVMEEFDLAKFTILQTNKPVVEDIKWCGHLDRYDDAYDSVSTKNSKPLQRVETKAFYYVTTTDDPVIEDLTATVPSEGDGCTVFATDAILAHLMACPRSVYPWDIVVQKIDGVIVFDKRDDSQFDYLTVSETAYEAPTSSEDPNAINTPDKLSLEASSINQNFTQQILKPDGQERKIFDEPNPFYDEEESGMEPASVAYRYRKFTLGNVVVVARCELHASVRKQDREQYMTSFALNEWDSNCSGGVEWRQKIDSQRGAVLATELKNNSCKLAKWTAQSVIAGADQMKIGFVSRAKRTDPHNHLILATQFYKPQEFAHNITLSPQNMWGIIKMLADKFMTLDDGKYVIMKDPNKPIVRIYSVPAETFEDEDEEDEEEGEDEDGEDEE
jgi:translation initiation factor 3 subunit D